MSIDAGGPHVVAWCRGGFEAEAAADLDVIARAAGARLVADIVADRGYVTAAVSPWSRPRWTRAQREHPPIFCRALMVDARPSTLPDRDRVAPLLTAAQALHPPFASLWLETADTNTGRELSGFCRRFGPVLEGAMTEAGLLDAGGHGDRLHVLVESRAVAWVGTSDDAVGSPWPMGIPRLRLPGQPPSRSSAKLAEGLLAFLGDEERERLHAGMRAVDLGAAPGGWTWVLAQRGVRVTAVDNGALKGEIADDALVTHLRVDGLTYRPRRPVHWLVCDIADQPSRIAAVVAGWIARGDAKRAIFNLKLPMKRRYDEVQRCRAIVHDVLDRAGVRAVLALRQLYHDREEVTGYLARD